VSEGENPLRSASGLIPRGANAGKAEPDLGLSVARPCWLVGKRGDVYTREVSAEVTGRLGINTASGAGRLKLNPVVGVRHERTTTGSRRMHDVDGGRAGRGALCEVSPLG
jgi:hypothetical protein